MEKQEIYIIVAVDEENGIGKNSQLPWNLKKDMKHFVEITTKTKNPKKINAVMMGRTTWESIPEKYRPLRGRKNIVLTSNNNYKAKGAGIANSLDKAFSLITPEIEKVFIIGGGKVFEETINHPKLTGIFITKVHGKFDCDTFFPKIPKKFSLVKKLGSDEENSTKVDYKLIHR
ncbi:MAG: dihydrofolate reductase [Patescibacteria group bacterium]